MKKITRTILGLAVAFLGLNALVAPAWADVTCPDGSKRASASDLALCNTEDPTTNPDETDLMKRVQNVVSVVLGIVAFVAVVAIVISGVQFMTARGDPGKIAKAKNAILYAVIGLIVAVLAYAIVNFVLSDVLFKS